MTQGLRILTETDVRRLLTLDAAIDSQRACFRALGAGEAVLPERLLLDGAAGSVAFCYAARLHPSAPAVSKFGSVNPANSEASLPVVNAAILVLDPVTGLPAALVDGTSVTEIRTAAASAVAAEVLAPSARTLSVLGTGVQGLAHVRAMATTHQLAEVALWGRDRARLETAVRTLAAELPDLPIRAASSAHDAVAGADLVALATTSATPVIETGWLVRAATVISVGSFAPDRHEYAQDLVTTADVVAVDDLETAAEHAGPIAEALRAGAITPDAIATLGGLLTGTARTREDGGLVLYNSVGIGAQDAAAATVVLDRARAEGAGRLVDLSE